MFTIYISSETTRDEQKQRSDRPGPKTIQRNQHRNDETTPTPLHKNRHTQNGRNHHEPRGHRETPHDVANRRREDEDPRRTSRKSRFASRQRRTISLNSGFHFGTSGASKALGFQTGLREFGERDRGAPDGPETRDRGTQSEQDFPRHPKHAAFDRQLPERQRSEGIPDRVSCQSS